METKDTYQFDDIVTQSTAYFNEDPDNALAASIFASKYALRNSTNEGNIFYELTPDMMHDRAASELHRIECKYKYPRSLEEIRDSLNNFQRICLQGSPMYGIGNPYARVSLSNCIVIDSPTDDLCGIIETGKQAALLFATRAGVGLDISTLRPLGTPVRNAAGTSTGAASFMDYYSNVCRTIGQNGRRGALMITMDVNHPDIYEFVRMKSEDKTKVTGANISVKISDAFMKAVMADEEFWLQWPVDVPIEEAKVKKQIKAKDLWRTINECAVKSAEPGLIFWDNYLNNLPACEYPQFKSISTNPCVTGDTLVAVADGREHVAMGDLVTQGDDVPVYCLDDDDKMVVRMMRNPHITQHNAEIYAVTLDDGSVLRVTKNHRFRMRDGKYKETCNLSLGDSIHIATKYQAPMGAIVNGHKVTKQDYWWWSCGQRNTRADHRLIAEFHYGETIPSGHVVHHKDRNALNNTPTNLEVLTSKKHDEIHVQHMFGDNNPMRVALKSWSKERWDTYKETQRKNSLAENNPMYSGVSHDQLKAHAIVLTQSINRRFSTSEWQEYAKTNGLPQSMSKWRKDHFGGMVGLSKWAALECGIEHIDEDPRVVRTYQNLTIQGYNCIIENKQCFILKVCEVCGKQFSVDHNNRQAGLCSISCNASRLAHLEKRIQASREGHATRKTAIREQQLKVYSDLKFNVGREPMQKEWQDACRSNGVSPEIARKTSPFRNMATLRNEASMFNHRVVNVEMVGHEDVYNGSVDEYHNYYTGAFECMSPSGKTRFAYVNNKNCGEVSLSAGDSCRLTSINLTGYVRNPFMKKAFFDYDAFGKDVRLGMRFMDDIVDLEIERLTEIRDAADKPEAIALWQKLIDAATDGRRTGLGIHGLGSMLAMLCIKYDTEQGIETAGRISKIFKNEAYSESINLAKERGTFPVWNWEIEKNNIFLNRLRDDILQDMETYGRRNISCLTMAPTGSVSMLSSVGDASKIDGVSKKDRVFGTTSGCEPSFANVFTRKKKINPSDKDARIDFVDVDGEKYTLFLMMEPHVRYYLNRNPEILESLGSFNDAKDKMEWVSLLNKQLPEYFVTSHDIDPMRRIDMQAALTMNLDHGMSSTLNLPKGTKAEEVESIYEEAWRRGLKGVTIYVDGSRSGILNTITKDVEKEIIETNAPKRPDVLPCDIRHTTVTVKKELEDGTIQKVSEKWTVIIGKLKGHPYEIFAGPSEDIEIPKNVVTGEVRKVNGTKSRKGRPARYDLTVFDEEFKPIETIEDIISTLDSPEYATTTRLISGMLRHGVPIQYVVEQLQRDDNEGLYGGHRVIGRMLKEYIRNGASGGEKCPTCGEKLVFEGGCHTCHSCGYAGKCG